MSSSESGSSVAMPAYKFPRVRILKVRPAPDQWVLVQERNMEGREPCEIWRSGVNKQLYNMKQQMTATKHAIRSIDEDITENKLKQSHSSNDNNS